MNTMTQGTILECRVAEERKIEYNFITPEEKLKFFPGRNRNIPTVSILTPTRNRKEFMILLAECILRQTYPLRNMEWIIADDGDEDLDDLLSVMAENIQLRHLKLITGPTKSPLGMKRNILNYRSNGEILINMDDDDYYPESRIQYAVNRLNHDDKLVAGSVQVPVYNSETDTMWRIGPYSYRTLIGATLAYRREFLNETSYNDLDEQNEEEAFLKGFSFKPTILHGSQTIVAMAHHQNTVPKQKIMEHVTCYSTPTSESLYYHIHDRRLADLYRRACANTKIQPEKPTSQC